MYQDPLQYEEDYEKGHIAPTVEKTLHIISNRCQHDRGHAELKENVDENSRSRRDTKQDTGKSLGQGDEKERRVVKIAEDGKSCIAGRKSVEAAVAAFKMRRVSSRASGSRVRSRQDDERIHRAEEEEDEWSAGPRRIVKGKGKSGEGLLRVQCIS